MTQLRSDQTMTSAQVIDAFIVPFVDADSNTWHRVVAGSYQKTENARRHAANLNKGGIDAFIVQYREG